MRNSLALLFLIALSLNLTGCGRGREDSPAVRAPDAALEDAALDGLIEGESILETQSMHFTGEDARLEFGNGAAFILSAEENAGADAGTININLLENDRFFNTETDLVFDMSETPGDYTLQFTYPLPPNLDAEDISLHLYSPGTSVEELDGIEVEFAYDEAGSGSTTTKPWKFCLLETTA